MTDLRTFEAESLLMSRIIDELARGVASSEMDLAIRINKRCRADYCMADCYVVIRRLETRGLVYMTTKRNWALTPQGRKRSRIKR